MKTDMGVSENKAPKNPFTSSIPGQAGGGSFKIERPTAYRAEQRLCL